MLFSKFVSVTAWVTLFLDSEGQISPISGPRGLCDKIIKWQNVHVVVTRASKILT